MATYSDSHSKAEHLASLVTGGARSDFRGASIQRSHRFPAHLFVQIQNMAQIGGMPESQVINWLIECGLEAVKKNLPPEVAQRLVVEQDAQTNAPPKAARKQKAKPAREK